MNMAKVRNAEKESRGVSLYFKKNITNWQCIWCGVKHLLASKTNQTTWQKCLHPQMMTVDDKGCNNREKR